MFFLRFVSVELVILGVYNIYGLYKACGAPTGALDVLRSAVLVSIYAIAVGFSLFNPLPKVRTLSLGFFYVLALSAAYYQVAWFVDSETFSAPSFLVGILHGHHSQLTQLLQTQLVGIAAVLTGWMLILLPPVMLNTADIKLFYGEDLWFSRTLVVRGWDLKPWMVAVVFALLANLDLVLQPKKAGECGSANTRQAVAKTLPGTKPVVQHVDPQQRRWDEDKERASFAAFAQNNSSFWVILSSGKLVHYNLTNYKSQVFDFATYAPGSEDFLSFDGKYFYSPLARQIFSVATASALSIPVFSSERVFLGFAKNSSYLVYIKERHLLQLLDAETGATIFELRTGLALKHEDIKWSSERNLILFRISDVAFQLVNMATGKTLVQNLALRQPENIFDDSKLGAVLVNGPVGFNKEYKTYKIDTATLLAQELKTSIRLLSLDPVGGAYLSGEKLAFQIVDKANFQDDNPLKIEFRKVTVVPNLGSLVVVEDATPSVQLFDLKTGIRSKLTGPYSTGRNVDENNCVLAGSRDGQLLYVSCWKQAEVFWVSSLNSEKLQSWKFNLPFEIAPAASPKPVSSPLPASPSVPTGVGGAHP